MVAAVSLLIVLTVSILITRIATVALMHTGLSRESARFQARSAFTGVGFTTDEAEKVVGHPVRRRILMLLMLLGNAGIVTAISSMILTFVDKDDGGAGAWLLRFALLIGGVAILWTAAYSQWLDQRLSRLIRWALARWTSLDVRDYASLLRLSGEYTVTELQVEPEDWMADCTLEELRLREEGVLVLGVQPTDGPYVGAPTANTRIGPGDTVLLYGREKNLAALDQRVGHIGGQREHLDAVAEQRRIERDTEREQNEREKRRKAEEESGEQKESTREQGKSAREQHGEAP